MDEFDVYMDAMSRNIAIGQVVAFARLDKSRQFILITPQVLLLLLLFVLRLLFLYVLLFFLVVVVVVNEEELILFLAMIDINCLITCARCTAGDAGISKINKMQITPFTLKAPRS